MRRRSIKMKLFDGIKDFLFAADDDSLQVQKADADRASHIGYGLIVTPGRALKIDTWQKEHQLNDKALSVAAEINYSPLPQDNNAFARDFNYPLFRIEVQPQQCDYAPI